MTTTSRAIGYIRVSTLEQAAEGVSLDTQRAKIAAWADLNGYTLAAIYEDAGLSGADDDRPGLAAALAAVRPGDTLVAYSLTRLSRSTRTTLTIAEQLERSGADLVSLSERIDTTSAAGKMVFRLLAVLAEFERDQIAERTRAALAWKRQQNQRVGQVRWGYQLADDGVHEEPNADEQATIAAAKAMRDGGTSLRRIGARLAEQGYRSRTGRPWHPEQIKMLLAAG